MTLSRTRARRKPLAFAVLLLQLLLVGAAPYADAQLEAEAYSSTLHVESEGADCATAHDHAACQLCRVLHLAGHPPVPAVTHGLGREPVSAPPERVESRVAATSTTLPLGSRAPPAASI